MPVSRIVRSSAMCGSLLAAVFFASTSIAKGHHGHHHFRATGTVTTTAITCGSPDVCFDLNADLLDNKGNSLSLSGSGQIDENKCHANKGNTCCHTTESGTVADGSGDSIDEGCVGLECTNKSDTKETLKCTVTITGGTGKFEGATGSGKLSATIDPADGSGPITVSGVISR